MSGPPNPFRALESYTKSDRESFFGRDGDLTLVIDRILTRRTTLLFAASGAGKTSFINARVVPELEGRFFIASHNRWSGKEPGALVLDTVRAEWAESPWNEKTPPVPPPSGGGDSVLLAAFAAMQPRKSCSGALLILDQFEEVFQQHADTPGLAAFVNSLAELINAPAPDVRVLFSMREEFLGELSIFDNRIPDLFNNYYRLKNPSRRQARSIIVNIVGRSGVVPDAGLSSLLDDLVMAGQVIGDSREGRSVRDSVPPPYLQIACHGLWEKQFQSSGKEARADGRKKESEGIAFPAEYTQGGALAQLHSYCDGILKRLDDTQRDRLAEALGFLITRRGAKVAYEVSALAEHSEMPEDELRTLLDLMSAKGTKLFRRTEAADGSTWYELYHDMYAPFLTLWKASHQKERRARARQRWMGAGAAGFVVVASIAGLAFWSDRAVREQVVQLHQREVNTPIGEYRLRFGRHKDGVLQVVFSPGGKHIATASLDGTAKLWSPKSGLAEQTIAGDEPLNAVVFHPNPAKTLLATGGARGAVRLFDWSKGAVAREWRFGSAVYALAFDPNGQMLACGGEGQLLQWYPTGGGDKQSLAWPSIVNALLYLPTRDLVLADSGGRIARIHDNVPATLSQFPQRVVAVATSPDGQLMAAGGYDRAVRVFDRSGKTLFSLAGNSNSIWSVAISPDSKLVASGAVDGTIRIWETEKGAQVATLLGHVGSVNSIVFDPSGKTLISAGQDASVRVWDVASRQQVANLEGEWASPKTVQFSADLTRIVTEGSKNKTQLWAGAQLVEEFDESVTSIAITRDGRTIAHGNRDGSVDVVPDTTTASRTARPAVHLTPFRERVRGVVFSGNGDVIAVESSDARTVRVMDVRDDNNGARHDTTHVPSEEPAWFVALDETGHSVALAGKRHVEVFDRTAPGAPPVMLKRDTSILGISYNVFGQLTIVYEDRSVEVAVGGGTRRKQLPSNMKGKSTKAAVAEDGRSFAFAGSEGEIEVWTPWSNEPIHITVPRPLLVVAFSRDGKRLGTLDETGTARTYSVGPEVKH